MYLTRLELEGLRGAEHLVLQSVPRLAALPAGPDGCAVADAIELLAAALEPSRLTAAAARLSWSTPATEVVGEGADRELLGLHPASVAAVVADGVRAVTVDAAFALDPPLFGRLREHAHRDPRMVTALGQHPSVRVKAGWLFTRDRTGVAPSVLTLRIGEVAFETGGKDRPQWVPELLHELGRRFRRTDPFEPAAAMAERLLAASLSADPLRREGWERVRTAVTAPPFALPAPGLVRADDRLELAFGPSLARLRQLGRPAADALRLLEAALLDRPDVLVVDDVLAADVRAWLAALIESPEAPIEQVWTR